jgi:eukaryotic-like serine/threonine-protein kinase
VSDLTSNDADPALAGVPPEVYADASFRKKYELERGLGVGGAGVVVCARHRELDERVAIKFLQAGPENQDAIARFRREARAANRVKDEHVVRIIDVATTETGVPYVVMEYLDGLDLERMLQQTPDRQLPVRDAIEFVLQASEALAECHAVGIVHRDLKPSNLFCTHGADGLPIIKVLDFGISKLGRATVDGAMTGKHALIGSPRYMSPEQFSSPADVDHRTDIWALGIILYELVTGAAPFVGNTVISIWESVKADTPRPIEALRRDAPAALGRVIARCLEKAPGQRFQNLAELAKALLPFGPERSRESVRRIVRIVESPGMSTASLSLPPSGPTPVEAATTSSVQPRPASAGVARIAAGVVAAAVIAVAAVRVARESARPPPNAAHSGPSAAAAPAQPSVASPTRANAVAPPRASASAPIDDALAVAAASTPPAQRSSTAALAPQRPPSRATRVSTPDVPTQHFGEATASAANSASSASSASSANSAAPRASAWIVDIVEKRKNKPGGPP